MDPIQTFVLASLLMITPVAILALLFYARHRWKRSRGKRSPLTKSLLKSPGTSLRKALLKNQDELFEQTTMVSLVAAYLVGFFMGKVNADIQVGWLFWVLAAASLLTAGIYVGRKIFSLAEIGDRQRLGLDGELAVGEELNHLMRSGFAVFHDIPGPNYNIDHAVVGPNGVFAVETKVHAKTKAGYIAEFDGRTIRYPDRIDTSARQQALRGAKSLSKYLSSACGETVPVTGVVVLPGWSVKQTGPTVDCIVLASGQIQHQFPRLNNGAQLNPRMIKAIEHQLDLLCRSESPMSLSDDDDKKFSHQPTL